jgi:integrase/recombinase XerD
MLLHEATDFFLNACELEKNLSSHTLAAYSSDHNQFRTFLRVHNVEQPSSVVSPMLHGFVAELKNVKGLSDSSIRRKIAVLRRFFRFLEQREISSPNPFNKAFFAFRQRAKIPEVLSRREVMAMMNVAKDPLARLLQEGQPKRQFIAFRDNALLELLFYTGALGFVTTLIILCRH